MKHLKTLELATFAAIVLVALADAGSASATILTSPAGTQLGVGTEIKAESSHTTLTSGGGLVEITCQESKLAGKLVNAGSSSATAEALLQELFLKKCTNGWSVTVLKPGNLTFHTDSAIVDRNGTLTSLGAEITWENGSLHCIYTTTTPTDIGTLTGSVNRSGASAVLDLSATLTRSGGRSGAFCGPNGALSGSYTFNSPSYLDVD